MAGMTERELACFVRLLEAEEMACKKARMYANTLTDRALAEEMEEAARSHARRLEALCALCGGGR